MNQKCKVCGEPAAGFHFGAFTCEGCKSFFGRTCNNSSNMPECKNSGNCSVDKKNRTVCKACRLRKCFMVGMSKSGSRYGRRSNWFKVHCLIQEKMDVDFGTNSFGLYGDLDQDPLSHLGKSTSLCDDAFPVGSISPRSHTSDETVESIGCQSTISNIYKRQSTNSTSVSTSINGAYSEDIFQELPMDLSRKHALDDAAETPSLKLHMGGNVFEDPTGACRPLDLTVKTRIPLTFQDESDRQFTL
ncbi:protein embryonic gonad-like [Artemia franciscana]|uniref:Nuclear receptor domain-containing protein n=1 Tax=Artemia franciscana TaxID=6661 RepID=A0AA88LDL4_ARTSF|nr:hypothetical protein QYM36_002884 [Artemia franciscana]